MAEAKIVGVQFNSIGKVYHFSIPAERTVKVGDIVLVSTTRGRQLGQVVRTDVKRRENAEIQPIDRLATEDDLAVWESNKVKERAAVEKVREFLKDPHYEGVKVLSADYSFDGNRLTLYLNYDPNKGFDIRSFLHEISHDFPDTHIEIRQVGPRDVARAISGLGACGIEKRCCSRFLTDFSSISIKMAKSQDISLTPMEITGMCGRLRCCLAYEYETYEEARKNLPKRKKIIQTPLGEGKVVQVLPLSNSVVVELPEKGPRQFTLEELQTGKLSGQSNAAVPMAFGSYKEEEEGVEFLSLDQPATRSGTAEPEGKTRPERPGQRSSEQPGRNSKGLPRRDSYRNRNQAQDKQNRGQRPLDDNQEDVKTDIQELKNSFRRHKR